MASTTLPTDHIIDALSVIRRIQDRGELPTVACQMAGVNYSTFRRAISLQPELAALMSEAEDHMYDAMAEALVEIDNHPIYGRSNPKMAAIISGNIKWLLSKRKSKTYGDKSVIEHQITADKEVLTALQASKEAAHTRALAKPTTTAVVDMVVKDGVAISENEERAALGLPPL